MKIILITFLLSFTVTLSAQESFKENGKYGIKDNYDSVLVAPIYKKIESIYNDDSYVFKGFMGGDWYLITNSEMVDLEAYESIEYQFDEVEVVICKRHGYFDIFSLESFDFIVQELKADDITKYTEIRDSLYEISVGKKQGLYDINADDYIIFPEYDEFIANFDMDINLPFIAYKKKKKSYTLIDGDGEVIYDNIGFKISAATFYDSTFSSITLYSDKMKEGYLHIENELIIPPLYDLIMLDPNQPNFIIIASEKGEGFYWKDKLILEPKYDAVRPTDHLDYAGEVIVDDVWYYVEHSGELVLKK